MFINMFREILKTFIYKTFPVKDPLENFHLWQFQMSQL